MTPVLLAFSLALVLAALLTPVVRRVAIRFDLLDHAISARKIHGRPVPRLGGVAIVSAFLVSVFVATHLGSGQALAGQGRLAALLGCSFGIALLGIVDDLRGANAWQKFGVQLAAAGAAFALGIRIEIIANPFGAPVILGGFSLPFTLLWIVGVTNAFNLIDGLDGLAAGVAVVAVGVNFLIAYSRGEVAVMLVCAALAGATVGFLRHNCHPASIFMGDTGSMFLGFTLATLAVESRQKATTAVALLVPIVALGLPILDTSLALVRRFARGQHVFQADREHIHHRLLALGLTHRRAVLALYGVSALFGVVAVALHFANETATLALVSGLLLVIVAFLLRLGYIGRTADIALPSTRRADAISGIRSGLRAGSPHEVWQAFRAASAALDADGVRLQLTEKGLDGETVTRLYEAGQGPSARDGFVVRLKVRSDGRERGWVEFGWQSNAPHLDPETEEALRLLCDDVATSPVGRRGAVAVEDGSPFTSLRWRTRAGRRTRPGPHGPQ